MRGLIWLSHSFIRNKSKVMRVGRQTCLQGVLTPLNSSIQKPQQLIDATKSTHTETRKFPVFVVRPTNSEPDSGYCT